MGDWLLPGIGAAVCAVFLLIRRSKDRRIQKLVSEGRFVWAEITGLDNPWKVNGRTYCCFRARYRDESGAEREFLSDAVKLSAVHGKTGCNVKVYVSDSDPDNYWIDAESIGCEEK